MEKWKNGKMEKWKNGKMEKWHLNILRREIDLLHTTNEFRGARLNYLNFIIAGKILSSSKHGISITLWAPTKPRQSPQFPDKTLPKNHPTLHTY